MPPTSNIRSKPLAGSAGGATTTVTHINDFGASASAQPQRRTASGRAVRVNTTRPNNYYARPFANAANHDVDSADDNVAPGFYPALQFFTDAVTALPKEMARQFTVMSEAQAKICGLDERFQEMVGGLLKTPVPAAKGGDANGLASLGARMLSFTANNSLSGSASASVVNGGLGAGHSTAASVVGEDENAEEDLARRRQYHDMGMVLKEMLPNMEEKNNGLLEVVRQLNMQLSRIDSVMPYIDEEISDEARYGSMTHWAYSDNRQKKQAPVTGANRRDVAATNSLAAAANAIHETEIAQARRDATRETVREKHKGRAKEVGDSDFDDKPKKTHAKLAKSKAVGQPGTSGLGISGDGEPIKRRKVDKGLAAPEMERGASAAGKSAKGAAAKDGPRSTPNAETGKKTAKAKPLPAPLKRKGINSAQASPALASSPLHASFTSAMDPPASRPQNGRLRQNSTTNLRHERLAGAEVKRPDSSSGKPNGEKLGAKRKARADDDVAAGPDVARKTIETDDSQIRQDEDDAKNASRSGSNSGKAGRGSKTGTPRHEGLPEAPSMKRTRSTRSRRANGEESSSEPQQRRGKHRRHMSNSHLVKQLAPYNRSPDLDRNRSDDDDAGNMEGVERDGAEQDEDGKWRRSPRKRKTGSRRNTLSDRHNGQDDGESEHGDDEKDTTMLEVQSPLPMDEAGRGSLSPDAASDDQNEPPALSATNSPTPPPLSPTPPPATAPAPPHRPTTRVDAQHSLSPSPHPSDEDDDDGEDLPTNHTNTNNPSDIDADEEDEEEQDPDSPSATRYCYCDRGSYGEMIGCDNPQCPREWFHLGCTDLREMPGEKEKWYCRDCRPIFLAREGKRGRGRGGAGNGRGR